MIEQGKRAALPLLMLIAGCVSVSTPMECDVARAEDGWRYIEAPPAGIPDLRPDEWGYVVIWFRNAELDQVKACERPRQDDACLFEEGTTFERRGDEWVQSDDIEVIICTR